LQQPGHQELVAVHFPPHMSGMPGHLKSHCGAQPFEHAPLWQVSPLLHVLHVPPLLPQAEVDVPVWQTMFASQHPVQVLVGQVPPHSSGSPAHLLEHLGEQPPTQEPLWQV